MIRLLTALLCLAAPAFAYPLVSADGKTKDFPVVIAANPIGLIVRESPTGKDVTIPWDRIDVPKTAAQNPWLTDARAQAEDGNVVELNLGLEPDKPAEPAPKPEAKPTPPAKPDKWTVLKSTVEAKDGAKFGKLSLSAYVHEEVERPRLAIVWVGAKSPLASRPDAADFARKMAGALVLADFSGPYLEAEASGSGAALVSGLTELFAEEKNGKKRAGAAPAMVIIGQGEAGTFAWSMVCERGKDVLAAVTIDAVHRAAPNAIAFGTPVLFLQSSGTLDLNVVNEDMTRPLDLWRHYSTDGCRWCYAHTAAGNVDPIKLAVAFTRGVAATSPYKEVVALLEDWENNALKNRIPIPARTVKEIKEDGCLLGTLGAKETFRVSAKTGDARNDLIWLPGKDFAAVLAR